MGRAVCCTLDAVDALDVLDALDALDRARKGTYHYFCRVTGILWIYYTSIYYSGVADG